MSTVCGLISLVRVVGAGLSLLLLIKFGHVCRTTPCLRLKCLESVSSYLCGGAGPDGLVSQQSQYCRTFWCGSDFEGRVSKFLLLNF